ncbi:MAG TPA: glycoside hydrolase family 2 TIM barrel-domain containing protein, partial [Bacteroidales bacterium]
MEHLADYIENLSVFEQNQEPGRCYFIPQKHLLLNGNWKFMWSDIPDNIPKDFFEPKFNDNKWNVIEVPSNWEMLGYGDKMFRNVSAPFHVNVPNIPHDYNPTGAYRKSFTLPKEWSNDQVFLRLEKVASASFVWINGKEVGYNEGAQEPAEYNITSYLKPGKNTIAVLAIKYSDGFYLEGQDYWRLSGIFDDVLIYATPTVRLFDWHVTTDFDKEYNDANLKVDININNYKNTEKQNIIVKSELYDTNGKNIQSLQNCKLQLSQKGEQAVQVSAIVKHPLKWTAETPNLYTLKLSIYMEDGQLIDKSETKIGFKQTKIENGVFYLNGVPIKVNAQNSHMQHPESGHVIKEEVIRKDFELLKQFNFNAVRTSHYPPVNKYLELANEYGLYVIDEAGVESHATEWVSGKPEFTEMYRERVRRMMLRDRNYPCILFWSAGNESGEGFNITEVVKEGKKFDSTRSWMYGGNAFSHPAEDIIGPRYPRPDELEIQEGLGFDKDNRPSFMDEYLSVAGNGCGGLDEYWRVIYSHPRTMGGAIWDFVSPGLKEKIRRLKDSSPNSTPAHIMGNAKLVKGITGKAIDLSGHDEWVEVYRKENTEIEGDKLTLTCDVFPRKLISDCGSFITKGSRQFGLQQRGKSQISFYIYTDKLQEVKAELPSDWEYKWHNIAGVYDGIEMKIYIDGKIKATEKASGMIKNLPYPINIGRNAEIHNCETNVAICDALIDNVGIFSKSLSPDKMGKDQASLWLDFEDEVDEGNFYSYGIGARTYGSIWPDRTPQPEMWQMKKTCQPLDFSMVDEKNFIIEIWNHLCFTSSDYYNLEWLLKEDDSIIQRGKMVCAVQPLQKQQTKLPINIPTLKSGAEYRIELSVTLKNDEVWAKRGHQVAWEQLDLPWYKTDIVKPQSVEGLLKTTDTDTTVVVSGNDFAYTFSKASGQMVSMVIKGKEMLMDAPRMNVWRAPLANELDDWTAMSENRKGWKREYGMRTVTEQYSTGMDDLTNMLASFDIQKSEKQVNVNVCSYMLTHDNAIVQRDKYISGIQTNGFENRYTFSITPDGTIKLRHVIQPNGVLPQWLMRMGLTMTLSKSLQQVKWYGRGPQENYPDRKTGYPVGIYKKTVKEMYEPYLIPQDYGLRTDNRWIEISDKDGDGLRIKGNHLFNFNIYPFTTENLTKAVYTYQLEECNGNTLNLDYSTSGVGCTARSIFQSYKTPVTKYESTIEISTLRH